MLATALTAQVQKLFIAFLPVLGVLACGSFAVWLSNRLMVKRKLRTGRGSRLQRQVIVVMFVLISLISMVLMLPINVETRNQLLALLGLALTVMITLSSTTFVANAMASFMLRTMKGFRTGDFVSVGEHFGRVTERGLFHTEIQTQERDFTIFPNLYLATHPLTVIHRAGTIVSATVSLGYDNSPTRIEEILEHAAKEAKLTDPFVHVLDLGDYSISYRVSGFLPDSKHILTARSNLRRMMIDHLHAADIEIVSPSVMVRRPLPEGCRIIPAGADRPLHPHILTETVENLAFDKAEKAEAIEVLRKEKQRLLAEIHAVEHNLADCTDCRKAQLEREMKTLRHRVDELSDAIGEES